MPIWLPSLLVGLGLIVTAATLMWLHSHSWNLDQKNPKHDEEDRKHYYRRYRRRMQTAAVLAIIGVLIPVGDSVIPWQNMPDPLMGYLWLAYWMVVLAMALWIAVLGLGDYASTTTHTKTELARIRAKQKLLEEEAARLKEQTRSSNGFPPSPSSN